MKYENMKVTIHQDEVFRSIDCHPESELYEEFLAEYEALLEKIYALCVPECLISYSDLKDQAWIMPEGQKYGAYLVLYSIGRGVSEFVTDCFRQGDYVKGMLADAMADSALFSMECEISGCLKKLCAQRGCGIAKRLETPKDMPMQAQRYIFEKTRAEELCGFQISEGYMLDPVKSNALIFLLSEDSRKFEAGHDCSSCNAVCKYRKSSKRQLQARIGDETLTLDIKEGKSILELLTEQEKSFGAVCGGKGRCGKCRIRVLEGMLLETWFDRQVFSAEELQNGMRLACRAYPAEPLSFEVCFAKEEGFQIVTDYFSNTEAPEVFEKTAYGIAIDIGTTTIAMQLIERGSGTVVKTCTMLNHQRSLGADVIARIEASVEGKREALMQMVRSDLRTGIEKLTFGFRKNVQELVIAGNTTMIHLLMGYDCRGLAAFPFVPETTDLLEQRFDELFHSKMLSAKVKLLPGISAFVGGDIVSGLYACNVLSSEQYVLLVDLGTNGEIALGNRERILVTSTAAGPAFEGGNIVHGVGSIDGAISNVSIEKGTVRVTTIGNQPPIGICGTGVIETAAQLRKEGVLDETGCLEEPYFEDGFLLASSAEGKEIVFTQQDVRELQLAKAAVRAGIETLILRYGISKEQVAAVYIAGGFGYCLNCHAAIEIGMFPKEFDGKLQALGNTSLQGAAKVLAEESGYKKMQQIQRISKELNLSADQKFQQLFMEFMYFE